MAATRTIHYWLLTSMILVALAGVAKLSIDAELIARMSARYGDAAGQRVKDWRDLMARGMRLGEREKLRRVNAFFNKLTYTSDAQRWNREDYWATPWRPWG